MKWLGLKRSLLGLFLLTIFNIVHGQNEEDLKIIEEKEKAVFIINCYDNLGKLVSQGSGFFINNNGIGISNYHVFKGSSKAEIKIFDGDFLDITDIIDFNSEIDLIKFKVNWNKSEPNKFFNINSENPRRGEQIINISNPLGLESTVSFGNISAIREIEPYGKLFQITAPISSGSSGSPIINKKGEVIGIVTFTLSEGQNLNFAISANNINDLNTKNSISYSDLEIENLNNSNYQKALKFYLSGQSILAFGILNEEIQSNPKNHLAHNLLGQIFLDENSFPNAIKYFFNALVLDRKNVEYLNNFGLANAKYGYQEQGDENSFIAAYDAYSEAIEIKPNYHVSLFNRAFLIYNYLYKIENPQLKLNNQISIDAIKDLENAIFLSNFLEARYYSLKGRFNMKLSMLEEADKSFSKAISIDPENSDFFTDKGELKAFYEKKYNEGISYFSKAISITDSNEKRADIYGLRSIAFYYLNDFRNACNDARIAFELNREDSFYSLIVKFCR